MKGIVKPEGPLDAKIVIVGEAGGYHEAESGRPFVGEAGRLLTTLMHKAGIIRESCYITNVIKERPPNNKIAHFIDLSKTKPVISSEGEYYLNLLERELSTLNPNVIVACGNTALWALTGKKGIKKWRGSVISDHVGRKVIPIIHPAACLYAKDQGSDEGGEYLNRYYILFDLQRILRHSAYPDLPLDDREYIIRPTFADCVDYLDSATHTDFIAFDIEIMGGQKNKEVSCISFSFDKKHAISIPFIDRGRDYFTLPQEAAIWQRIAKVLEGPHQKLGQNVVFDATFLFRKYGIRCSNLHDTMIAQGILYPDFPKGLGFITSQYTDIPYYKDEGKEKFQSGQDESFWLYNAKDSIVLLEAFERQMEELNVRNNRETYEAQRQLIEPLVFMGELGMRMDVSGMEEMSKKLEEELLVLKGQLQTKAGVDLNPNAPAQLRDYFYITLGLEPYRSRKTGKPTVDEKALKRLARRGFEEAQIILDYRRRAKLKGTYLDMRLDPDDRLRTSFNPVGTKTGRLSSSKTIFGTGGNLQNLPKTFRIFVKPDPGFVMIEVDLSQAENRLVAYIAPDMKMMEAFEKGIDIHSRTAGLIFGMNENDVKALDKEFEETKKITERLCAPLGSGDKSWRFWGKQANHALNYGLYYVAASLRWEIPQSEAQFIYEKYHAAYPGVKKMHRWIKQELLSGRTLSNCFGRRMVFFGSQDDIEEKAYGFIPQSTVADIINRWGLCYIYENTNRFPKIQLLNQIHDALLFQIPLSVSWKQQAEMLTDLKHNLEQTLTFRGREFRIPAEFKMCVDNWKSGVELKTCHIQNEVFFIPDTLEEVYDRVSSKHQTV